MYTFLCSWDDRCVLIKKVSLFWGSLIERFHCIFDISSKTLLGSVAGIAESAEYVCNCTLLNKNSPNGHCIIYMIIGHLYNYGGGK